MKNNLLQLAERVGKVLSEKKLALTTAESCTGGGIAQAITQVSGSSIWFDRGFVTYSNYSKSELLSVSKKTIKEYGAVSNQVVREMVRGAFEASRANITVAVSGIAGPGGGSQDKPVGTVYLGWGIKCQGEIKIRVTHFLFSGDRLMVRNKAVEAALDGILKTCEQSEA